MTIITRIYETDVKMPTRNRERGGKGRTGHEDGNDENVADPFAMELSERPNADKLNMTKV